MMAWPSQPAFEIQAWSHLETATPDHGENLRLKRQKQRGKQRKEQNICGEENNYLPKKKLMTKSPPYSVLELGQVAREFPYATREVELPEKSGSYEKTSEEFKA
ncbi:MAG: hypothetical protein HQL52_04985 [Magnetococcales bacterium]|nr:hypothetical protein [Magnetococcales bacterium]